MTQAHSETSVLDRLATPVHARLAELANEIECPAGATLLHDGDDTPFLGVIESGRVALRLRVPELGDRLTLVTCEVGELVGWSAVVAPFRTTVDAVTTEPTRLTVFDAVELRGRLAADCELAAALLPLVLESVCARLSASWAQLLDLFGPRSREPW